MKKSQNKTYETEFFRDVIEEPTEYSQGYYVYLKNIFLTYVPDVMHKKLIVLEAGCGTGVFGKFLLNLNSNLNIVGVDITPEMVNLASKNPIPSYTPIVGDLEDEGLFDNDYFELILCPFILHHFPVIDKVLSNLTKWLKPDGFIILLEANGSNPLNKLSELMRHFLEFVFGKEFIIKHRLATPNETAHSVKTYVQSLRKKSLEILFVDTNHLPANNIKLFSFGRLILYELRNILYKISMLLLPKLLKGSRIVIIAKN